MFFCNFAKIKFLKNEKNKFDFCSYGSNDYGRFVRLGEKGE